MDFEFVLDVDDMDTLDELATSQGKSRDEIVAEIVQDFLRVVVTTSDAVRFSVGSKKGPKK